MRTQTKQNCSRGLYYVGVRLTNCFALALLILLPAMLPGEVADSTPGGFTIRGTLTLQVPPADAYQKFVRNTGSWWASGHTFSRDSKNLSIDDQPGGCFCEKWPDGGVQHLQIVSAAPGKAITMRGGLGPLMALAVTAGLEVRFIPDGAGTRVTYTYSVGGYIPNGAEAWAKPVDGMLAETFGRFRNYANTGNPDAKESK